MADTKSRLEALERALKYQAAAMARHKPHTADAAMPHEAVKVLIGQGSPAADALVLDWLIGLFGTADPFTVRDSSAAFWRVIRAASEAGELEACLERLSARFATLRAQLGDIAPAWGKRYAFIEAVEGREP